MSTGNELVTLKQVNDYYKDLRKRSAPVIFNSAVGNPAVFSDGADGLPIQSLKVYLLPRQEGSGDASPENIRSIIPWNGIDILGGGKNLLNVATENAYAYSTYTHYTINNGSLLVDGGVLVGFKVRCKPMTTYTFSIKSTNKTTDLHLRVYAFETEPTSFVAQNTRLNEQVYLYGSFTTQENDNWLLVGVYVDPNLGSEGLTISDLQLEVGQTATAYEPYKTITETDIVFPSSVYGGVPDVVSGVMTVTHALLTKNTAEMNNNEDYPGWKNSGVENIVGTGVNALISNVLTNVSPVSGLSVGANTAYGSDVLYLNKSYFNKTQSEWKALSIDIQILVPLVTPVEIQLIPAQLQSLLGSNTIWSDANGDIEVEYRADTGLFLKQNTVKDVQLNGISILKNLIANIPLMSWDKLGVAKVSNNYGLTMGSTGGQFLQIDGASQSTVKAGGNSFAPITPSHQHEAAFYGLAKVAGADMAQSSNPVGTYADTAKTAIQKMLGFNGILGDYELSAIASKAYAVGETFIFNGNRYRATSAIAINDVLAPGTNCVLDPLDGKYVRNTDYALSDGQTAGVVIIPAGGGKGIDINSNHELRTRASSETDLRNGVSSYAPLTPHLMHRAVFFALSKAAGVDLKNEAVSLDVYPQTSKTAIQAMLGVPSTADLPVFATKAETEEIITEWSGPIIPSAQGVSF